MKVIQGRRITLKPFTILCRAIVFLALLCVPGWLSPTPCQAQEPRVWAHKVSWTSVNNLTHTSRRDFPLGMGQAAWPGQPLRYSDQQSLDDCAVAQAAGIDAFAIDLVVSQPLASNLLVLNQYLQAAAALTAQTGKPFAISPCIDSPSSTTPAQLAALIQALTAGGRSSQAAWAKVNGLPVVWTYNGSLMSTANWQATFALLGQSGTSVAVMIDANSLVGAVTAPPAGSPNPWAGLPTADLAAYAGMPVGLYVFRTDCNMANFARCRQFLSANYPSALATQLTVGTIFPGYWSEVNGWLVDPQGTARIRNDFQAAASSRWITVTTWDDYAESTEFQPTLNHGTGRLDLLHALLAPWRGDPVWPASPSLYVWQPNEVHVGEALSGEALMLAPPGSPDTQVQVTLSDPSGNAIQTSPPVTLTGGGVQAIPFSFPVPSVPASRCDYLSLTYQVGTAAAVTSLSPPVHVWPGADNPWRTLCGAMWRAGVGQATGTQPAVIGMSATPTLMTVPWAGPARQPGAQIFPRQNFNLLNLPPNDVDVVADALDQPYVLGGDSWDTFSPVMPSSRWGFYDALEVQADGTTYWQNPAWVDPAGDPTQTSAWHLDEGSGSTARDSSPYGMPATLKGGAAWASPGQSGPSCVSLNGTTGYVSLPAAGFPKSDFTFRAWIKPTADGGPTTYSRNHCVFVDSNGNLMLKVMQDGTITAARMVGNAWVTAQSKDLVPVNAWSQVAATYDQQTLRVYLNGVLEGSVPCQGVRMGQVAALGCSPSGAGSGFFAGQIDEVVVYSQALPPSRF